MKRYCEECGKRIRWKYTPMGRFEKKPAKVCEACYKILFDKLMEKYIHLPQHEGIYWEWMNRGAREMNTAKGKGYILESFKPVTLVKPSPLSNMGDCLHKWVFLDRFGAANWHVEIFSCDKCGTLIKVEHLL